MPNMMMMEEEEEENISWPNFVIFLDKNISARRTTIYLKKIQKMIAIFMRL